MFTKQCFCFLVLLLVFTVADIILAQKASAQLSFHFIQKPFKTALYEIRDKVKLKVHFYHEHQLHAKPVDLAAINVSLDTLLYLLFSDQPVTYRKKGRTLFISPKTAADSMSVYVQDAAGMPLRDVFVEDMLSGHVHSTDKGGRVVLGKDAKWVTLKFSHVSCITGYCRVAGDTMVVLEKAVAGLEETVVTGYSKNSRALFSGATDKMIPDSLPIGVGNSLADQLRYPTAGVQAFQITGPQWGNYLYNIRGSVLIGYAGGQRLNDAPLIVLDRAPVLQPFMPQSKRSSLVGDPANNGAGFNILSSIPADIIESIDFLKDAVATAPYGSRGANGVIMITSKKNAAQKGKITASFSSGIGTAIRLLQVMDPNAYRSMRQVSLRNDEKNINTSTAADLLVLDSTRNMDWPHWLLGNTAHNQAASLAFSRKWNQFDIVINGNYSKRQYILPVEASDTWKSLYVSLQYHSADNRFTARWMALYGYGINRGPAVDVFPLVFLLPMLVDSMDANGKASWKNKSILFSSPSGWLKNTNQTTCDNWFGSGHLDYRLGKGLHLALHIGWTSQTMRERNILPLEGMMPNPIWKGSIEYAAGKTNTWVLEPQVDWAKQIGGLYLNLYAGTSWQMQKGRFEEDLDGDYNNDIDLYAHQRNAYMSGASPQRYGVYSSFAGLNTHWNDQLSANLALRVDNSSRVQSKAWGLFYASGVAWIFSNAPFLRKQAVLSYGKLRVSYGITGGDQPGLAMNAATDHPLAWMRTRKLEAALHVQFWKKFDARMALYRHTSLNQSLSMPFTDAQGNTISVMSDHKAVVSSSGAELLLGYTLQTGKKSNFHLGATFTMPRNKLVSFAGTDKPPYNVLLPGYALSARRVYRFTGIDQDKGYAVKDLDQNGEITFEADAKGIKDREVDYYAQYFGTLTVGNFRLSGNVEARKQSMLSTRWQMHNRQVPGNSKKNYMLNNQPQSIAGELMGPYSKRFTAQSLNERADIVQYMNSDDAFMLNTSWLLKMLQAEYDLPDRWLQRVKLAQATVYIQGDNPFFLNKKNRDINPMLQNYFGLPAVRTITIGIRTTFLP